MASQTPTFFAAPPDFRAWLQKDAENPTPASELIVGFHKKGTGQASITWPEAVDEALCFGWIDGVRKRLDENAYQIRFTPRKTRSIWSAVNIERVRILTAEGRMQPGGMRAFANRTEAKSGIYAYEQTVPATLRPTEEKQFRRHAEAWLFFQAQGAGYRQRFLWRIVSAKQESTRTRRLEALIAACAKRERL